MNKTGERMSNGENLQVVMMFCTIVMAVKDVRNGFSFLALRSEWLCSVASIHVRTHAQAVSANQRSDGMRMTVKERPCTIQQR